MHRCVLHSLLAVAPLLAADALDPAFPLITVGPTAVPLAGFGELGRPGLAELQPTALIERTAAELVVTVSVPLPGGRKPVAEQRAHDGPVWEDDCVELFLDPGHTQDVYYQLMGNAAGSSAEGRKRDAAWNAPWEYHAEAVPGGWQATFRIPFSALGGVPPDGALWGLNACVDYRGGGNLTWSPLTTNFHEPARFGHLRFSSRASAGVASVAALLHGTGELRLTAKGDGLTGTLQRELNGAAQPDQALPVPATGELAVPIDVPRDGRFAKSGRYGWRVTVKEADGTPALRFAAERVVKAPLTLHVRAFVTDGTLRTEAAVEPAGLQAGKLAVRFSLQGGPRRDVPVAQNAPTTAAFARADVPKGRVTVRAELIEGADSVYQAEQTLDRPLDPAWLNDATGLTDRAPAPWTPVTTKNQGQTVVFGCWDRSYQFARGPLPERVNGGGKPLLDAPVTLKLYRDGKPIAWSGTAAKVTSRHATDATVAGALQSSAAALTGTSRLEFDGMLRTDLTLTPTATAPDRVELEIPIRPEFARYLYHFPGSWGTVRNAAALPDAGWEAAFTPFVWLGNEDRGLCWFCESDQFWSPADPKKAVTIVREGDRTVLRLHLWEGKPLTGPVKYTFGFQATPVKQPDKTVWDYRIHHGGDYGLPAMAFSGSSGRIEYPAAGQIRGDRGTFECWAQLLFDSDPTLPEEKKRSQGNRMLFTLSLPDNTNMGIYWNEMHQGPVVWVREQGQVTFYNGASFAAKRGEWHHLAFTWSDTIRAYIDGTEVFSGPRSGLTRLPLDKGTIRLGDVQSPFVIDEVRILDEARPPAAPFGPYEPDAHTLLLDHLDAPVGEVTAPAKGAAGKTSGVKASTGKFGQAVALGAGEDQQRSALDRLSEAGVRTICFHEHWTPWQSHPYTSPENEPKLTALVEAVHSHKMQLLLYMSRQFADIAPEYALYSEDVLTMPKTFGYNRQPTQQDWGVCWKSHWKEFCLAHLAETMDRFGNDGWYLDGPEWPCPCTNRHHGCGYVRPDGTIAPTYDIFATRDFMRRLYVLTRQRKPGGQLNIHNSTVMVIPTLGWGTSSWDGEQLGGIERGPKVLDVLPLDSFRCEMMGRQWGVPAEFLCYERPYSTHEALSFTLLHDVLVRPNGYGEQLDELSGLWKLAESFGHRQAKLLPYWSNADVVKTDAPEVLVTLWSRGAAGVVAVVSNLSEEARTAGVTLDLAKLGLRGKVTAVNAITKAGLMMSGGKIEVPLKAFDYAMVWVK